jgi:hypothetical protein
MASNRNIVRGDGVPAVFIAHASSLDVGESIIANDESKSVANGILPAVICQQRCWRPNARRNLTATTYEVLERTAKMSKK